MMYRIAADLVVVIHLGFIVFVVLGGLGVFKWHKLAWLHIPAAAWAASLEFFHWRCPLTPVEQWLRLAAGETGYSGGFIPHYLMPLIYPAGLDRDIQFLLGSICTSFHEDGNC